MKFKKLVILPMSFLLIHILYIGCCKCVDGAFLSKIKSFRTTEYSKETTFSRDTVKVTDTLFTNLMISADLVNNSTRNPMSSFVNTAYAFSCDCIGAITSLGYTSTIDSLVITSNQPFKGITAGSNLSNLFLANYAGSDSISYLIRDEYISIPRLLDSVNINKRIIQTMNLIINPTPIAEKMHRFTYKLYSNGQAFTYASTKLVIWN